MQKFRLLSYTLIVSVGVLLLFMVGLVVRTQLASHLHLVQTRVVAQVYTMQSAAATSPLNQVVVGPSTEVSGSPSVRSRYKFDNGITEELQPQMYLVITDTQTGETMRLGDETGGAAMKGWDEDYLFWDFGCGLQCSTYQTGLYAYSFADKESIFVSDKFGGIHPKRGGDWVAHSVKRNASFINSMLFATNLRTHETITLTTSAPIHDVLDSFAISPWLAVWKADPPAAAPREERLAIYDLATRTVITEINPRIPMGSRDGAISKLGAGQSVITWDSFYGYDLVTNSYFTITKTPPNVLVEGFLDVTPVTEENRILRWTLMLPNGEDRYFQAPLIDPTPPLTPCIAGQDLVQNGNLEDTAQHALWPQSGSPSNLLVNDLPAVSPQGGQWAIRLGRYRNATQEIRQLLTIPAGVEQTQLHFDVQVNTWDIWGGDRLEVDFIDPTTNQSILLTPVRWNSRQLPANRWVALDVQIEAWPSRTTPVYLVLRGVTDWAIPTDFTVDNVRLVTLCQ